MANVNYVVRLIIMLRFFSFLLLAKATGIAYMVLPSSSSELRRKKIMYLLVVDQKDDDGINQKPTS